MGNKIKYNLKNVHAAVLTETTTSTGTTYSYDTPEPIPGAVSISLDAEGDTGRMRRNGGADAVGFFGERGFDLRFARFVGDAFLGDADRLISTIGRKPLSVFLLRLPEVALFEVPDMDQGDGGHFFFFTE